MRIALGRTRMLGRVEESILRRSLGRRPYFFSGQIQHLAGFAHREGRVFPQTFAISSLFLNSPLTSVTSPFLSNSVHRNRSSFDTFPAKLRPILNKFPVPSSRNGPLLARVFFSAFHASLSRFRSSNLRSKGPLFVDACLDGPNGVRNDLEVALRQADDRVCGTLGCLNLGPESGTLGIARASVALAAHEDATGDAPCGCRLV